MNISRRIVLRYPPALTEKPIVYQLVKKYDVMFNILKANFLVEGEGMLLLELSGTKDTLQASLDYLKAVGVAIELLSQDVARSEEQCTHCGICSLVCPTQAFFISKPSMEIGFEAKRCIGCEECVRLCPYHAVKISLV